MLHDVQRHFRETAARTRCRTAPLSVWKALARTPREPFVPASHHTRAYEDRPLPIGHGQTISQPFVVALTLALLRVRPTDRVLDVGTGSGYTAALLARLAARVEAVELERDLADAARTRLERLGRTNVGVHAADGHAGWPAGAPYDAIACAAAARRVPSAWIEQLAPGGRLVTPVTAGRGQVLVRITKSARGGLVRDDILPVAFVPLRSA